MKVVIHDLDEKEFKKMIRNIPDGVKFISYDPSIHHCIGCFGCWIKTPGTCILKDAYQDMGALLGKSEEVLIISQCYYGSYSPFVKNVLDRSISYVHPYFVMKNGEMHHRRRYENQVVLNVWFYGEDISTKEKQTAQRLVYANANNLHWDVDKISFKPSVLELEGLVL